MELAVPVLPSSDFNFDCSNCSSPYITAPSSPQKFGTFNHSTSKSRTLSQDFHFLDDDNDDQFEFNFSGPLVRPSLSAADELFDGGKIRPLIPQQKDQTAVDVTTTTSRKQERGRERTPISEKPLNYKHKGSRSLSPLRVSDLILDQEEEINSVDSKRTTETTSNSKSSYSSSFLSAISLGYKKWKLKDLLLFRSASEGRAIGKDQMTRYALLSKRSPEIAEDLKNSSFRSTESGAGSCSRRRGRVSAHELHYTANRAVSEEMKRKTFLPYRHGLLGCLGFNQDVSRSIGSLTRG